MQTLNIKVTQQAVILQNKDPVTAENVNQIRCVVELDPAYADLVVRVCMNGQFATVVDGPCFPAAARGNVPPGRLRLCRGWRAVGAAYKPGAVRVLCAPWFL